ncbi:MAG: hypothetical protein JWO62_124 [Acidimicrobiaceae bacterium]|jgi:hypothetical protein|nr:hypothetical protein [Acidimicrobiaceae bacterium]
MLCSPTPSAEALNANFGVSELTTILISVSVTVTSLPFTRVWRGTITEIIPVGCAVPFAGASFNPKEILEPITPVVGADGAVRITTVLSVVTLPLVGAVGLGVAK